MGLSKDQALKTVDRLYQALSNRRPEIERYDRYYRGDQPLAFASKEWRKFHADRYKDFSDNWCGVVANAPAERLRVTGIALPEPGDEDDLVLSEAERKIWSYWTDNDFDEQSSQGFLSSIVAKRSFVLVWGDPDTDEPVMSWEDASQVIIDYDAENVRKRRYALKSWISDNGTECATLYTPTEVWKFERTAQTEITDNRTSSGLYVTASATLGGGWRPRQPEGDDTWPITNPMGEVPVVEFKNRPLLGGQPLSDIHGATAMQDSINLLWAYLFTAADHASMPARVIMGQEPPKIPILNEQGQKVGDKAVKMDDLAQGRFLWLTGKDTKIGSWPEAKLDVFTGVIGTAVDHLASQSRTPPHYLSSSGGLSNISGDTLQAAETGLAMRAKEGQLFFTPSTREVLRLAALADGEDGLAALARRGVPKWRDAETRSEAQLVDALQKLQAMGFPFQWCAERYGLDAVEVARLVKMKQDETDSSLMGSAASVLRDAQPV